MPGEVAIVTDNTARDAAGTRLVRFQDDEASGKTDKGCKRRALVAALFLVNLNNNVLAFLQDLPDVRFLARLNRFDEVFAGDFLEWQKAMSICAEVDERGLETGLDARNLSFVNISFFSFAFW